MTHFRGKTRRGSKTKSKVAARNNILRKLTGTTWGANPSVLRTTALALCYSAAEYACPVWERSVHARKLDPVLNETCRLITGCLKPTKVDNLYVLSGIAPPDIRRAVASQSERSRQVQDQRHMLHHHVPVRSRLKSRSSFCSSSEPLQDTAGTTRLRMWQSRDHNTMGMTPAEHLPPGFSETWPVWKSLNRLRTGVGRCRSNMVKWGYQEGPDSCGCGQTQTMQHLLVCPQLSRSTTPDDLASANHTGLQCAKHWSSTV